MGLLRLLLGVAAGGMGTGGCCGLGGGGSGLVGW